MASKPPKLIRSDLENKFQGKIIDFLNAQGCFTWKMQQNATTKAGVADVFFCKEGFYGFLEVKKSKTAKRRPGQPQFIKKMNEWSWAAFVYPEIWPKVKKELEELLK